MIDRSASSEFIFGYGSLVLEMHDPPTRQPDSRGYITDLEGFRRAWEVAMDNTVDLPGYKYYRAPDGTRPAVFVAFLDIVETVGSSVNGMCLPVAEEDLFKLDAREQNYDRVEVTHLVSPALGRTWTYVGSSEGRERLQRGRTTSSAVIARSYRDQVLNAFAILAPEESARFEATTDAADMPVWELERIDLPGASEPASIVA